MDEPVTAEPPSRYSLTFVTDQWEWDAALSSETLTQAKSTAKTALEAVVRDEAPELACVYIFDQGVRVGVWDWVERQPYWTPL